MKLQMLHCDDTVAMNEIIVLIFFFLNDPTETSILMINIPLD